MSCRVSFMRAAKLSGFSNKVSIGYALSVLRYVMMKLLLLFSDMVTSMLSMKSEFILWLSKSLIRFTFSVFDITLSSFISKSLSTLTDVRFYACINDNTASISRKSVYVCSTFENLSST